MSPRSSRSSSASCCHGVFSPRVGAVLAACLAAGTLHGCEKPKKAIAEAKPRITSMVCDQMVSASLKRVENKSITLLESVCEKFCPHWGLGAVADVSQMSESEADTLRIETQCLGEGAQSIMGEMEKARHELDKECSKFVMEKLDELERNGTTVVLHLWKKAKAYVNDWLSFQGSDLPSARQGTGDGSGAALSSVGTESELRIQLELMRIDAKYKQQAATLAASKPHSEKAETLVVKKFLLPDSLRRANVQEQHAATDASPFFGCLFGAFLLGLAALAGLRHRTSTHTLLASADFDEQASSPSSFCAGGAAAQARARVAEL